MNKEKIEQLAMEVLRDEMPKIESDNQSYFYGIVNILTDNIIVYYRPNKTGTETEAFIRELMIKDLKELIASMNYQK